MCAERLHTIAGCMFSGKSSELLRLVEREEIAGRGVQVFKPIIDDRWGKVESVSSHSGAEHTATAIRSPEEILSNIKPDIQVVAIDEVQFLNPTIIGVVQELLDRDIHVIVAGLPTDFRGEPFGAMPNFLTMADEITHLTAICTHSDNGEICGQAATRTQRIVEGQPANYSDPIIMIGAKEAYAARCPNHHLVPGKPSRK